MPKAEDTDNSTPKTPEDDDAKSHKLKLRKRPKGIALKVWCIPGPFEKREQLFEQLDHFQEFQAWLSQNMYRPILMEDACKFFNISMVDLTQALTSAAFANYSMAMTKIKAQQATRELDKQAVKAFDQLAKSGESKDFLMEYSKRLKDVGFTQINTEELEDLRRDEGSKLIEQLSESLRKLNGGTLPPIQRVLPLVLGHSSDGETTAVEGVEEGGFDNPTDEMAGSKRPDSTVVSSPGPSGNDEGPPQVGNSGPGQQVG
jgi:hypothetical protein